jgi:two-component system LytT family sensor kinase
MNFPATFITETSIKGIERELLAMNSIKSLSWKNLLPHISCWILFIAYELGTLYFVAGTIEHPYVYLVYYPIHIAFFYTIVWLLNQTFDRIKPRFQDGLLKILLAFSVYLIIKLVADFFLGEHKPEINSPYIFIQGFYIRNINRGFYFLVLAVFYWAAGRISYFRRQSMLAEQRRLIVQKNKAELETQLAKSQSAYHQQQINPHLLFNALNFVYSKVQEHSDEAAHCVWLLAEIMHFSLQQTETDGKINLVDETAQIRNLLEINAYRFPVGIVLTMDGEFERYRIIPLILLTLTENIFKHGDLTNASMPALLHMEIDTNGQFVFRSQNLKKSKNTTFARRQLGLQNVCIRLDEAYPEKFRMDITEREDIFELTLIINL